MKFSSRKSEEDINYGNIIDAFGVPVEELNVTIKQATILGYSILVEPGEHKSSIHTNNDIADQRYEDFTVYLLKKGTANQ
ncbi:hypothetical protein WMB10_01800 [Tetragenococcus halophilus]|uniref:hypothetical protein n=1 Tax=Tetragenococcus halophilus TaxID=51669 RepID=UPI0030C97AFA